MMCVVIDVCESRDIHMDIHSSLHSLECADGVSDGFRVDSISETDGCCGHAVFNVHPAWNSRFDPVDHSSRPYKVESVVSETVKTDVLSMKIRSFILVVIGEYLCFRVGRTYRKTFLYDQGVGNLRREDAECLLYMLQVRKCPDGPHPLP